MCILFECGVGCNHHDVTTGSFIFNIEAMPFIEFLGLIIDFEYFQTDPLGLLLTRRNSGLKQSASDAIPLMMRVNNDHSYEQLVTPIFNMRIPNQFTLFMNHRNAVGVEVSRKVVFLPRIIPAPNFRNVAAHYQAIQFENGFFFCLIGFSVRVSHDIELYIA